MANPFVRCHICDCKLSLDRMAVHWVNDHHFYFISTSTSKRYPTVRSIRRGNTFTITNKNNYEMKAAIWLNDEIAKALNLEYSPTKLKFWPNQKNIHEFCLINYFISDICNIIL